MKFLVDDKKKIIFGWSPKCGCTHIKKIFLYLYKNEINLEANCHPKCAIYNKNLPDNIHHYTTIIICRNPYKRLISGFLDKYNSVNGKLRHLWKHDRLTFREFIEELIIKNWNVIDKHHFEPQTSDDFKEHILNSKKLKIFDIENIDYGYIENLYNKKIPNILLNEKGVHIRKKYEMNIKTSICDVNIDDYYEHNVEIKYFYDDNIKNKIYGFYKEDFLFFNKIGINY